MDSLAAAFYAVLLCLFGITAVVVSGLISTLWVQKDYPLALFGLVTLGLLLVAADIVYQQLKRY